MCSIPRTDSYTVALGLVQEQLFLLSRTRPLSSTDSWRLFSPSSSLYHSTNAADQSPDGPQSAPAGSRVDNNIMNLFTNPGQLSKYQVL